ncbi:hypothetical protein B0H11DRAFT_1348278 [Mycena galericulata]|nr:hypothetical protein B0H11DRAFT_1348278 [Mycena galericulata]
MRLVRAFSSSVRRGRQPLFEIENRPLSAAEKTSLQIRNRLNHYANPWIARDARTLRRALFRSGLNERHEARSDLTRRVALALAKLQDPRSFQVEDMTLDTIFRLPCLSHPSELGIMDRYNPLGVPPDTPKEAIPPIHDPSLVAQALSEAGFTGSFLQFDRTRVATEDLQLSAGSLTEPWPTYKHIPHGGYVYPPRLLVDAGPTLDSITLTLPGVSIKPLYNLFKWFHRNVGSFKSVFELVTLWAQSHGIPLTSQSIALMIIASMQNEEPLFDDYDEKQGWAPVDCREDKLKWYQAVGPVYVDFKEARVLAGQHSSVPEDYIGFFRHWRHRLPKTWYSAFSVRKGAGALNQLIHRQYNSAKPRAADFRFSESELDDPTTDFIPWCYDCLVIQDPFLITHNHAENLSAVDIRSLGQEIERTFDSLHAGKPLSWSFGKRLVPPGSKAETKILNEPKFYSAVLNLVRRDRVPGHLLQSDSMATVEDTRPPLAPPETRRKNVRPPRVPWDGRGFHASSVSLAKRGGFNNSSIASPEPVRPRRSHRGIEGSASGVSLFLWRRSPPSDQDVLVGTKRRDRARASAAAHSSRGLSHWVGTQSPDRARSSWTPSAVAHRSRRPCRWMGIQTSHGARAYILAPRPRTAAVTDERWVDQSRTICARNPRRRRI